MHHADRRTDQKVTFSDPFIRIFFLSQSVERVIGPVLHNQAMDTFSDVPLHLFQRIYAQQKVKHDRAMKKA